MEGYHVVLRSNNLQACYTDLHWVWAKRPEETQDFFDEKYQPRRFLGGYHGGYTCACASA